LVKGEPEAEKPQMLEEPKTCSECGMQNPTGYRFCFRCNALLDKKWQKRIEDEKEVKNALNLIARDNDLSKKFSQLLEEAFVKQKDVCKVGWS